VRLPFSCTMVEAAGDVAIVVAVPIVIVTSSLDWEGFLSMGKGSTPRSCFSRQFKDNYDAIDWSRKDLTSQPKPANLPPDDQDTSISSSGDAGYLADLRLDHQPRPILPRAGAKDIRADLRGVVSVGGGVDHVEETGKGSR
jgi:hypothetical protein